MRFTVVNVVYDADGKRELVPTGEEVFFEADVIIAIGQDNAFPWIDLALSSASGTCRWSTRLRSRVP